MTTPNVDDRLQAEYPEVERGYLWNADGPRTARPRVWLNGEEVTDDIERVRIGRHDATFGTATHEIEVEPNAEASPGMFDGRVTRVTEREGQR